MSACFASWLESCFRVAKLAPVKSLEPWLFRFEFYQNNIEGEIINKLHSSMGKIDGIIINAGAYTHTSLAIADAIKAINIPTVEVHLSNIYSREEVRHKSFLSPCCIGQISGFGFYSYILAVYALINHLKIRN